MNDRQKFIRLQAAATDKGTVYAGSAQQRGGVVRHNAAAILNRDNFRGLVTEDLPIPCAKDGMRVLGLLWGGMVVSIADRLDRLVRDADAR